MKNHREFNVIIIGGSYAGLSAAMALGRSLRKVLVIDSGKPCNRQTPFSHNFITHDGETPSSISAEAKRQVLNYPTVTFINATVTAGTKNSEDALFEIRTSDNDNFKAAKLLFATGLNDIMPSIKGFSECWGITILHCPYCHGYEVRQEKTGIIGNGDYGFEMARLIHNWTVDSVLFTNGKSMLTKQQAQKLSDNHIEIIEGEIDSIEHTDGKIKYIILKDGSKHNLKALYARPAFTQHSELPAILGCELTEQGLIKIDDFQKTTVAGIFAAGDNSALARSLAISVAAGSFAGAFINKELIEENF